MHKLQQIRVWGGGGGEGGAGMRRKKHVNPYLPPPPIKRQSCKEAGLEISCYKSGHKLSVSCVRTVCSHVVATSLNQVVDNLYVTSLMALSDLLQGCSNN